MGWVRRQGWRWGWDTCFSEPIPSKDYPDFETISAEVRRRGRKGEVSRMGWSWPEEGLIQTLKRFLQRSGRGRKGGQRIGQAVIFFLEPTAQTLKRSWQLP